MEQQRLDGGFTIVNTFYWLLLYLFTTHHPFSRSLSFDGYVKGKGNEKMGKCQNRQNVPKCKLTSKTIKDVQN